MVGAVGGSGPGGSFPATRSLLDPQALLAVVAAAYPVDEPRACTLLRASWNDTYAVDLAEGRLILRVYGTAPDPSPGAGERPYPFNGTGHALASIRYELDLLTALAGRGVPVAAPIARRDGELLTPLAAVEGVRQLAVFPFARGEVAKPHPFIDAPWSFRVGVALAELHVAGARYTGEPARPPRDLTFYLESPLATIAPYLAAWPERWRALTTLAGTIRHRLAPLVAAIGFVHGDPFNANASIADDGQITWYDFDLCGPGWAAMDLAGAYGCTHLPDVPAGEQDRRWQAFLAGYRTVRPIAPVELAAVPALLAANRLFGCGFHLTKAPIQGLGAVDGPYFDRYIVAIRQALR